MPSPSEITVIQGKSSVGLISYLGKKNIKGDCPTHKPNAITSKAW